MDIITLILITLVLSLSLFYVLKSKKEIKNKTDVKLIFPAAEVRDPVVFKTCLEKYLVLGGSGYVGTNLISSLLERGEQYITIYDLMPVEKTSPLVQNWVKSKKVKYIVGDITSPNCIPQLQALLPEFNIIFYMITIIHYWLPPSLNFLGKDSIAVNINGTNNFLEALVNMSTTKHKEVSLIYISSISVLESTGVPIRGAREEDLTYTTDPFSWYAKSKAIAERAVLEKLSKQTNVKTIILRPVGLYGIDDRFQAEMIWKSKADRFPVELLSIQDSLYIGNLIYALLMAEDKIKSQPDRFHTKTFIITDDNPRSLTEFNRKLTIAYRFRNNNPGDTRAIRKDVHTVRPVPWWILQLLSQVNWCINWATRGKFYNKMGQFGQLTTAALNLLKHDYYFDITRTKVELGYYPIISEDDAIQKIADYYLSKYPMIDEVTE